MTERAKAIMQLKAARKAMTKAKDSITECSPEHIIQAEMICRDIERLIGCIVYYTSDETDTQSERETNGED